jgi:hypothetical protein
VRSEPSLFFQIAAALIPGLLLAGAVQKSFRPERFRDRRALAFLVGFVIAVYAWACIVAEVLALKQSVSATSIPPEGTTRFVVWVLVVGTAVAAAAFAIPWVEGALPPFNLFWKVILSLLLGALTVYLLFLGSNSIRNAVHDATVDQLHAQTYCVLRVEADALASSIESQERYRNLTTQIDAGLTQIRKALREKPRDEAKIEDLYIRNADLVSERSAVNQHEAIVAKFSTPDSPLPRGLFSERGC